MVFIPFRYVTEIIRKYSKEVIFFLVLTMSIAVVVFIVLNWKGPQSFSTSFQYLMNNWYVNNFNYFVGESLTIPPFDDSKETYEDGRASSNDTNITKTKIPEIGYFHKNSSFKDDLILILKTMSPNRSASSNLITRSIEQKIKNFLPNESFQLSGLEDSIGFQEVCEPIEYEKKKDPTKLQINVEELLSKARRTGISKFLFSAFIQTVSQKKKQQTDMMESFRCSTVSDQINYSLLDETDHILEITASGNNKNFLGKSKCYGLIDHSNDFLFVVCVFDISNVLENNTDAVTTVTAVTTTTADTTSNISGEFKNEGVKKDNDFSKLSLFFNLYSENTSAEMKIFQWSNLVVAPSHFGIFPASSEIKLFVNLKETPTSVDNHFSLDANENDFGQLTQFETKLKDEFHNIASKRRGTEVSLLQTGAITLRKMDTFSNAKVALIPSSSHLSFSMNVGFSLTLRFNVKDLLLELSSTMSSMTPSPKGQENASNNIVNKNSFQKYKETFTDMSSDTETDTRSEEASCPSNVGDEGTFGKVFYVLRGSTPISFQSGTYPNNHSHGMVNNISTFMIESLRSSVIFALAASKATEETIKFSALSGRYGIRSPVFFVTPQESEYLTMTIVCCPGSYDLLVYCNGSVADLDDSIVSTNHFFLEDATFTAEPSQVVFNVLDRIIFHSRGNLSLSEIQSIHKSFGPGTYKIRELNISQTRHLEDQLSKSSQNGSNLVNNNSVIGIDGKGKCKFWRQLNPKFEDLTGEIITEMETTIVQPFLNRDFLLEVRGLPSHSKIDTYDAEMLIKAQELMLELRSTCSEIRSEFQQLLVSYNKFRDGQKHNTLKKYSEVKCLSDFIQLDDENLSNLSLPGVFSYNKENTKKLVEEWEKKIKLSVNTIHLINYYIGNESNSFLNKLEKKDLKYSNVCLHMFLQSQINEKIPTLKWTYHSDLINENKMSSMNDLKVIQRKSVLDDRKKINL